MSSHHQHQDDNPSGVGLMFWLILYAALLFGTGMILKGVGL